MEGENSDTDESCTSHCTESTNTRKANLRLKVTLLAGLWGDRDAAVTDWETELVRLVSIPVNTASSAIQEKRIKPQWRGMGSRTRTATKIDTIVEVSVPDERAKSSNPFKNSSAKYSFNIWSGNPTLSYYPREIKVTHENLYINVLSSFIHNCPKLEIIQISTHRRRGWTNGGSP